MVKWEYTACSRPLCQCASIKIVEDVDGNKMVCVEDDYNGSSIMSIQEFKLMAENFLEAYSNGEICESD